MCPKFVCSICGEEHEGLPTEWAHKLPDEVWAIPEVERSEKARFNDDLCQYGERYFIRCVLPVPFRETEGGFGWGVWAEVKWPVFERYLELYNEDGSAEPAHAGTLANALPGYEQSFGVMVHVQFRDQTQRPILHMLEDDQCLLASEQRSGINNARYHEILDSISTR